jgi:hypothetical protein
MPPPLNEPPCSHPPTTLLPCYPANWSGFEILCMVGALCSSSPLLGCPNDHTATPKYPSPSPICVCLSFCASFVRPILTSTVSLPILAPIRPLYSLCEDLLYYYNPFIFVIIRSVNFALLRLLRFAQIYYLLHVRERFHGPVPMHTCQPVPLKTDSHHTYLPCVPPSLQTASC